MTIQEENPEIPESSLKHRAIRGATWIAIQTTGTQATSFVVFAVLAHFVEPRDFGLLSISLLAVFSLKTLFLDYVMAPVVRKSRVSDLEYTTVFWMTIGLSALAAGALLLLSLWSERLFDAPGLGRVMMAMSVVLLFMGLARTHEGWMGRHFRFRALAVRSIVGAVVGGCIGVALAMSGYGVWALVVQQITTSVVSFGLLWAASPWRPGFHFSTKVAKEVFLFLRGIIANAFIGVITDNCDIFLVAYFFGPSSTGIYSVGKRLNLALQLVAAAPVNGVVWPVLIEVQDDRERYRRVLLRALTLVCAVCGPVFFGVSAVSHEAIAVVFGDKWLGAAPVLSLLAIGSLARILMYYGNDVFMIRHRPWWTFYGSLIYAVLAIALFPLSTRFGLHYVALPFVLPYCVVLPLAAVLVSRLVDLSSRDWFQALAPGIGASAVMFAIVRLAASRLDGVGDLARLAILCPIGCLAYMGVLWLVGRDAARMVLDLGHRILRRRAKPA
jgi:O-antigen/teichoic acid export membrane protein